MPVELVASVLPARPPNTTNDFLHAMASSEDENFNLDVSDTDSDGYSPVPKKIVRRWWTVTHGFL